MKKLLFIALLLASAFAANAQSAKRILVTYFSWSGSTKTLAEEIQRQTNADIYRIEPLVPYTTDYQTLAYQISNREKAENARPALKDTLSTLNDYDIIFVGCPVWWFDAPMIMHSFLECKAYDFSGKTVVPFCTYATAEYETLNDIIGATPDSEHLEGLGVRGSQSYSTQAIAAWLQRIGIADIVAGVDGVKADAAAQTKTYGIDGVQVPSAGGARKGVYIVGGKKVAR